MIRRTLPWALAAISLVALAVTYFDLQRFRSKYFDLTGQLAVDHTAHRLLAIRAAMTRADRPIVVVGDSITEHANFPAQINSIKTVNAGIGGISIQQYSALLPAIFENARPTLIVCALGINTSADDIGQAYSSILATLQERSTSLLIVELTPHERASEKNATIRALAKETGVSFVETSVQPEGLKADKVHLSDNAYRIWTPALVNAIEAALVSPQASTD